MKTREELIELATRLWPESPPNRARWLRAVRIVRRTKKGWLAERHVEKPQREFLES